MTDYEFGDVVLVVFPFTDQITSKKRPAVVVSSLAYNRQRPDIILMAVTNQVRLPHPFGDISITEWQLAGIIKSSIIKPIFATVEKSLTLKKLGRLSEQDRAALQQALQSILGE
jgi:mRNA interferase MazF